MNHWKRYIRLISILLLLVFVGCMDEGVYKIPLQKNEQFTEETAIRVSREALKRAGKDVSKMEPVSYRHELGPGENLLARNILNRNQGYMLWRENGGKGLFQYDVSMEKVEGYVKCDVGRTQ